MGVFWTPCGHGFSQRGVWVSFGHPVGSSGHPVLLCGLSQMLSEFFVGTLWAMRHPLSSPIYMYRKYVASLGVFLINL